VHALDHRCRAAERGDDDRRLVAVDQVELGAEPVIAAVRNQVERPGACAAAGGRQRRVARRDPRKPRVERFDVRALGAGKALPMPAAQAASTRSGPETRNIGAAISGSRSWPRSAPSRSRGATGVA
jgi:hypothetical protein